MDNLHDQQVIPHELEAFNESLNAINDYLQQQRQQQHTTRPLVGYELYVQLRLRQIQGNVQALQRSLEGVTTVMLHPHLWHSLPIPEETMVNIMTYLDVRTLVEIKLVSRQWQTLATTAIDSKGIGTTRKAFESNEELRNAVKRYCPLPEGIAGLAYFDLYEDEYKYINRTQQYCNHDVAEEIACMYGWPIGKWDVSNIEDFSDVFYFDIGEDEDSYYDDDEDRWVCSNLIKLFNEDISSWDVSKATTMRNMFRNANKFNQDLSSWDTSNVTNMRWMFDGAFMFNQDLSNWDTSNVTTMFAMFSYAVKFNQDISRWDTSNVTDMERMFDCTRVFNEDIRSWDTSNVTNMRFMFYGALMFNQDLSNWDTSNVTDMEYMFNNAQSFNQDLSNWDTSNVTNMQGMFSNAQSFNQDLSSWDTSNVRCRTMSSIFDGSPTAAAKNFDNFIQESEDDSNDDDDSEDDG